jgi:MoxR-like ATPase
MNEHFKHIATTLSQIIKGKEEQIHLCTCALVAGGHILIEDQPGLGKTTLAKAFAQITGKNLTRVQCTNDLLPADILGHNFFNPKSNEMEFIKGPVFADFLLIDEINRAPAKTQSALLQVMEEGEVSVENNHFKLDDNMNVIATQNPLENIGTFSLPESQLDRFMIRISMGHSNEEDTIALLKSGDANEKLGDIKSYLTTELLTSIRKDMEQVTLSDEIYKYIYRLLDNAREQKKYPLSNRAGLDLVAMARAHAYGLGEKYVIPDHVQYVF